MATTIPLNGERLSVRLVEIELSKLRLDPDNPRLHSSYLTGQISSRPNDKQIAAILEELPEFQSLLDSLARNKGCHQPPLVTEDCRVLEGNRRVAAMRKLQATQSDTKQWNTITVEQLVKKVKPEQEKALRGKFHLENQLSWDDLSILTEYLGMSERESPDAVAQMLGKHRAYIEPLFVAGKCVRSYSKKYSGKNMEELFHIIIGLCGVKRIAPQLILSRTERCIYTDDDSHRPPQQLYSFEQISKWLAEGRFTKDYEDKGKLVAIRPKQVPELFRDVREAGGEAMVHFLEGDGSLSKAVAYLRDGHSSYHRQQALALRHTQKYMEKLNMMSPIKREETPDLYRDAVACYNRLAQLLNIKHKEAANVH